MVSRFPRTVEGVYKEVLGGNYNVVCLPKSSAVGVRRSTCYDDTEIHLSQMIVLERRASVVTNVLKMKSQRMNRCGRAEKLQQNSNET